MAKAVRDHVGISDPVEIFEYRLLVEALAEGYDAGRSELDHHRVYVVLVPHDVRMLQSDVVFDGFVRRQRHSCHRTDQICIFL